MLVLPDPDGYLSSFSLLRQLRAAMKRAGVTAAHPKTGAARNWHSLRHSHARVADPYARVRTRGAEAPPRRSVRACVRAPPAVSPPLLTERRETAANEPDAGGGIRTHTPEGRGF